MPNCPEVFIALRDVFEFLLAHARKGLFSYFFATAIERFGDSVPSDLGQELVVASDSNHSRIEAVASARSNGNTAGHRDKAVRNGIHVKLYMSTEAPSSPFRACLEALDNGIRTYRLTGKNDPL